MAQPVSRPPPSDLLKQILRNQTAILTCLRVINPGLAPDETRVRLAETKLLLDKLNRLDQE